MQDQAVRELIRAACLDYVAGFFAGDATRMERSVYEGLAKRRVEGSAVHKMTREQLVSAAVSRQREMPGITVEVLDITDNMAVAKVTSEFVDHVQLAWLDDRWQVINVLWDWIRE